MSHNGLYLFTRLKAGSKAYNLRLGLCHLHTHTHTHTHTQIYIYIYIYIYRSRGKIGVPGHVVEIDHVEITSTQITADLRN